MFNKIILVGNLTRDCELRYLPNGGSAITTTGIATNRKFKNQMGEQKEEVCFVDITFFGRTAEIANQYLSKGKKVLVEGRLKLEQWTDQNRQKRSKHLVIVESLQMLGSKGSATTPDDNNTDQHQLQHQPQHQPGIPSQSKSSTRRDMPEIDIDPEEIPFQGITKSYI